MSDNFVHNFLKGKLPDPYAAREVILSATSKYSREKLDAFHKALVQRTFPADRTGFEEITIAQSGTPYVKEVKHDTFNDKLLKVFVLDYDDCIDNVKQLILDLEHHVQGTANEAGDPLSGFMSIKDKLSGNRDGPDTCFTLGAAIFNDWLINPVTHSVKEKPGQEAAAEFARLFHIKLGELVKAFVPTATTPEFIQMTKERQTILNPPHFGAQYGTQTFFTSAQLNCNIEGSHVQGTAGDIHCDTTDDPASYSLLVNVSLVRNTTHMGYFWFPSLDLVVPIKPRQLVLFQGIEEHVGTPIAADSTDTSPLPGNFKDQIRYNIIAYPKEAILHRTARLNLDSSENGAPQWNFYHHALPHFGGVDNWNLWRKIEMGKHSHLMLAKLYSTLPGFKAIDTKVINAITDSVQFESENTTIGQPIHTTPIQQLISTIDAEQYKMKLKQLTLAIRHGLQESKIYTKRGALPQNADNDGDDSGSADDDSGSVHESADESNNSEPQRASGSASTHPPTNTLQNFQTLRTEQVNLEDEAVLQSELRTNEAIQRDIEELSVMRTDPTSSAHIKEALTSIFTLDKLETELKYMETIPASQINLGRGIEKELAFLPRTETLSSIAVKDKVDLCNLFSRSIVLLQQKAEIADLARRAINACQTILYLEAMTVFSVDRKTVWEVDAAPFAADSAGYKLAALIDQHLADWAATPSAPPERVFAVNAKELLGDEYDPSRHANVKLKESPSSPINVDWSNPSKVTEARGYLFKQTLWGLYLYKPAIAFRDQFKGRQSSEVNEFTERLFAHRHKSTIEIFGRLRALDLLRMKLKIEEDHFSGFLMMDGLLSTFFGLKIDERIDKTHIESFLTVTVREEIGDTVQKLAKRYAKVLPPAQFLSYRGTRTERVLQADGRMTSTFAVQKRSAVSLFGTTTKRLRIAKEFKILRLNELEFAPSPNIVNSITVDTPFARAFVCYMIHVAKLGAKASKLLDYTTNNRIRSIRKSHEKLERYTHARTKNYLAQCVNTDVNGDRLMSWRKTGPSMRSILSAHTPTTARADLKMFIWHIFIWRLWGFGRREWIDRLGRAKNPEEALIELEDIDVINRKPLTSINAYGNFRIEKEDRNDHLTSAWHGVSVMVEFFEASALSFALPTFEATQTTLAQANIRKMGPSSLLGWLVTSDFADFGLCEQAGPGDLASKIGQVPLTEANVSARVGGSGPRHSLWMMHLATGHELPFHDEHDLKQFLTQVYRELKQRLDRLSEDLQGRAFTYSDLEHMMCKITRESKVMG